MKNIDGEYPVVNANNDEVIPGIYNEREVRKDDNFSGAHKVFAEMSMNKFLKRKCTVDEYYDAFNSSFSNKGLDEWYLIDLFIFALQPEIEKRFEMFKPNSLSDAYHLAKYSSEVVNNNVGLKALVELSKERVDKIASTNLSEVKDNGLKENKHIGLDGFDELWEQMVDDSSGIEKDTDCVMVLDDDCKKSKSRVSEMDDNMPKESVVGYNGEQEVRIEAKLKVNVCGMFDKEDGEFKENKERTSLSNLVHGSGEIIDGLKESELDKSNVRPLVDEQEINSPTCDNQLTFEEYSYVVVPESKEKKVIEYVKHIVVNSSNTDRNINFNKEKISRKEYEDTNVLVMHMDIRLAENEYIIPKTCRSLGCIKNVTSGSHVQKVLVNIHNEDDSLNQQKKKEVSEQEWRKRKKASHIKFRLCKFDMWEWSKQKKIGGARCEFKYKKCNFDILKWPNRRKERREESCEEIMFSCNEEMHNMFILWFDYSQRVIVKVEKKIKLNICLVQRRFYWLNIKYAEGDWVDLTLQPYVQVSVSQSHLPKSMIHFKGWLKLEKLFINRSCWKLLKMLCVFYLSKLRKWKGHVTGMGAFTTCEDDELSAVEPQMILARRMHKRDNKVDVYVLV
ncbi:hypothetical protein Tco_0785229 [Tanacetum coccineum]